MLPHAPSVQMQAIPEDAIPDDTVDEDAEDPDKRLSSESHLTPHSDSTTFCLSSPTQYVIPTHTLTVGEMLQ